MANTEIAHSKLAYKLIAFKDKFLTKEDNQTPQMHFDMLDIVSKGKDNQLICAFRGSAKSTIFTKWIPLFASTFGELDGVGTTDFILIVSDTTTQAEDMIRELKDAYDDANEDLGALLKQGSVWRVDEVEFINAAGHITNIVAKGAEQKVRGIKRRGKRPSLLIIDDLENDEAVYSEQSRKKLKNWFFSALIPCLHPTKRKIFFIGTPLHQDSLLENLRKDRKWNAAEFPITDNMGAPTWVDRFPHKWVEEKKAELKEQGMLRSFFQEYMLQIVGEDEQIFKPEYFNYYDSQQDVPEDLEIYITVDLAISSAQTADRTAIVVCGIDVANNIYILTITADRISPSEQVAKVISYADKYFERNKNIPVRLGVEMVSYQKAFVTMYEDEIAKRVDIRHKMPIIDELKADSKKTRRIQQLEMFFKRRTIFMPKTRETRMLEEELLMFPNARHDDISDAFAYILQLRIPRQGQVSVIDYHNDKMIGNLSW